MAAANRPNRRSANPSQPPRTGQPDGTAAEAALVGLYAWAQVALLTGIARILQAVPHTREGYQAAVPAMRALVGRVQATLVVRTAPLVQTMLDGQAAAGAAQASADVLEAADPRVATAFTVATPDVTGTTPDITSPPPPPPSPGGGAATAEPSKPFDLSKPHGERAAQAIVDDLSSSLTNVRERITRLPDDVYKAVAPHGAIQSVLDNGLTMRQTQAEAWREFLRHGITGFTDRSGRRWNLATYTEMAIRTASVRAFNDSHIQRMRFLGVRYFSVPSHETTCPLCWPWEGQVLSDGLQPDPGVQVAGTLNDAVNAGLFHPNCRHTLTAWLPNVSDPPPPQRVWGPEQAARYADTQRQRALERRVRRAKEAEALALDGPTRTAARKAVRAAQAAVRTHLDGKPHLSRNSNREQLHLGYARR